MSQLQDTELQELLAIARSVGWGAADILRSFQDADLGVQHSEDGPVTLADEAANRYILDNLQAACGFAEFGYLSEETYKIQPASDRRSKPYVWIIDPLDGTKDFIQRNGEYALHIALVQNGRPILAVVACPAVERLYFAALNGGCFAESPQQEATPVRVSPRDRLPDLTLVASRSHRDRRFEQLLQQFPVQKQRAVGSLGGKIAAIVQQEADVYLALSGKSAAKDWDLAAPELILTEAGGKLTRFDGSLLQYNGEDVIQWGGLLASNGVCHAQLCQAAARILAELEPQN